MHQFWATRQDRGTDDGTFRKARCRLTQADRTIDCGQVAAAHLCTAGEKPDQSPGRYDMSFDPVCKLGLHTLDNPRRNRHTCAFGTTSTLSARISPWQMPCS